MAGSDGARSAPVTSSAPTASARRPSAGRESARSVGASRCCNRPRRNGVHPNQSRLAMLIGPRISVTAKARIRPVSSETPTSRLARAPIGISSARNRWRPSWWMSGRFPTRRGMRRHHGDAGRRRPFLPTSPGAAGAPRGSRSWRAATSCTCGTRSNVSNPDLASQSSAWLLDRRSHCEPGVCDPAHRGGPELEGFVDAKFERGLQTK